jgi:hypothetical protein
LEALLLAIVESVEKFKAIQLRLQSTLGEKVSENLISYSRSLNGQLLDLEKRGEDLEDDGKRMMSEADGKRYAAELSAFLAKHTALVKEAERALAVEPGLPAWQ